MTTRRLLMVVPHTMLVALVVLAGCAGATGSGRVVTKAVSVESFSRIAVSHGFDVNVYTGDAEGVMLRIDDNLVDDVDVRVTDGTLRIGLRPHASVHDATLHADVTVRTISTITQSGGTVVHLADGTSVDELAIKMSGGSRLYASMHVANVDLDLSGGSRATLSGSSSRVAIEGNGASLLEAAALRVSDAGVSLSGASQATVSVSNTISAELSGSSLLRYRGNPTVVHQRVTGASSITKG
jgi:hypothetical protein